MLLAALATPAAGLDLETVLAGQARAMGPLSTVRTVDVELTMAEPEARYALRARMRRPDRYRIDLRKLGVSVYTEGIGSRGPWQQHMLQWSPQPPSAAGATALVSGLEWFVWGRSLQELRERGHRIEPVEDASSDREAVLRVTLTNGQEREYVIDRATFRVLRSRQRVALHPDLEGDVREVRWHTTHYENYRRLGGITLPFRMRVIDEDSGRVVQDVTVHEIRLNAPLEDGLFESR